MSEENTAFNIFMKRKEAMEMSPQFVKDKLVESDSKETSRHRHILTGGVNPNEVLSTDEMTAKLLEEKEALKKARAERGRKNLGLK